MTATHVFPSHNDVAYLRVLIKRLDPDLSDATPTQALPGDAGSTSWPSPVVLAPRERAIIGTGHRDGRGLRLFRPPALRDWPRR